MLRFPSSLSLKNGRISFKKKKKQAEGSAESPSNSDSPRFSASQSSTPPETPEVDKRVLRTPPDTPDSSAKRRKVKEPPVPPPKPCHRREEPPASAFGRYRVSEVTNYLSEVHLDLKTDDELQGKAEEKKVVLEDRRKCVLRGSWANTQVSVGDAIHVLTDWDDELKAYRVDNSNGIVVVEPDFLVSGTSVVSSLFCKRKAVLNERFRGIEGSSKTMFVGTLVHELLQECLKAKTRTPTEIESQLSQILSRTVILQDILALGMNLAEVRQEVEPYLPHVQFFFEKYVLGKDVPPPPAAFSGGQSGSRQPQTPLVWQGHVEAVEDIEENIWSPRLGLKGRIDLTVKVRLHNKDRKNRKAKSMPLELKTGRASGSAEHRGQVILYSMMMSERREDPEAGLLLYLRNSSLQEVKAGPNEMRDLIQLRNEMVAHLRTELETADDGQTGELLPGPLPEPLNRQRVCEQCPHLLTCAMHQKLRDEIPKANHAMAELVPQVLAHLSDDHSMFFRSFIVMCALEKKEALKASKSKSLWCQTPTSREGRAIALAYLLLKDNGAYEASHGHEFVRPGKALGPIFSPGETVIVSTDSELAICQGVVLEANEHAVKVALDKDLRVGDNWRHKLFHLDRYEYQGSTASSLVCLTKLMEPTPTAERLRSLIIDLQPPKFAKGLPRDVVDVGKNILKPLNKNQQKAIFRTLMAEDYVLLRGMPGTGKTTVIVALVRLMVALGKSVLLVTYTHSAVDTILLKLMQHTEKFLRLGRKSRIHPELVRDFSAESLANSAGDVNSLRTLFRSRPVIATTCLALNHPAVSGRTFDFCVVDEASQSTLLATINPLFHAKRFVLVGDPEQLPPVVQSQKAAQMGLAESLFSRLQKTGEQKAVALLNVQYRMNERIMALANKLVYKGQLECGSEQVAGRVICLAKENLGNVAAYPSWLKKIVSNNLEDSVIFVDTRDAELMESVDGTGVSNLGEADLVKRAVDVLSCSTVGTSIGIIAPYRAQVNLLRRSLDRRVDVNTVDQFQGKDKDIIIYSCTRSRSRKLGEDSVNPGEILNDLRRLNVAITRAKAKLVMVGNGSTLERYDMFKNMLSALPDANVVLLRSDEVRH